MSKRRLRPALTAVPLTALLLAAGCGGGEPRGRVEALPDPGLIFLTEAPRRRAGCVPLGESDLTRPWREPGADLVACRSGHGAGFKLLAERGARQVGRTPGWTVYSVPRPAPG